MRSRAWLTMPLGLFLVLQGCIFTEFDYNRIRTVAEASPVRLDGEQVMLTNGQVQCGAQEDLWGNPEPTSIEQHSVARLYPKGRNLKFDDDVSIGEFNRPYAQIRGAFMIQLTDVINNRDDTHQKGAKLVEAKVGVFIDHPCFEGMALPLMGVRRGKFTQDASPQFRFYLYNDGWHLESIVH